MKNFLFAVLIFFPLTALADSIICGDRRMVSSGASKGEVADKCGRPLSRDLVRITDSGEIVESWTYKIGGCYREFIFKGGRLEKIINGGLSS